jgi:hypothetical protein
MRTKKHKAADEVAVAMLAAASMCPSPTRSLATLLSLAHKNAPDAFTRCMAGKITPHVELLEIAALTVSGPRKARNPARLLVRLVVAPAVKALTPPCPSHVTWKYWQLKERHSSVLTFSHLMVGDAQRIMEHPYIDPTVSKPIAMLMVWAHTAAERVAHVVDGVYTLEVEQLHDLQDWCTPLCGPLSAALARSHSAHNSTTRSFHKMEVAPVQSSEDDDEAAPRSAKCKAVERGGTRGRRQGRGRGRGPATVVRPPPMLTTATNDAMAAVGNRRRVGPGQSVVRARAGMLRAPACHVRAPGAQDMMLPFLATRTTDTLCHPTRLHTSFCACLRRFSAIR